MIIFIHRTSIFFSVVVVEEPDEEPKVYEQQAYNANIESKQAAASMLTPPSSPQTMRSTPQSPASIRTEQTQKKQEAPPISHVSSTSTTRSNHRHHQRNKTKYRRQKDEQKASNIFQMPSFSRQYQATPIPPRFQQRFYHPNQDFHPPQTPNPNFSWVFSFILFIHSFILLSESQSKWISEDSFAFLRSSNA